MFVRYESTKDVNGQWGANGSFTNVAIPTITPPSGHTCTDTSVNEGCEHFGVGYYGTPTAVRYHWLIDNNAGGLAYFGSPVSIATPKWTYTAPAAGQPAEVVAVIPAPVVPIEVAKQFGEPSWVKVIKTTTHNANPVALADLISDDSDGDGKAEWQNLEPDEVETEWKLLQANNSPDAAKDELEGLPDDMGDGSETVTRRYEFYRYGAAADTLDGENGEAKCSEVNPTTDPADPLYLHGVGTQVSVTDANGDTYFVNCEAQVVVGNYIGAQMAGFDAEAPLGLVDNLQGGDFAVSYLPRTVVVGGTRPYTISIQSGSLPPGLSLGDYLDPQSGLTAHGVLFGTPSSGGDFSFTVGVLDASGTFVSKAYSLHITGAPVEQFDLTVQKLGTGTGTVSGNGIDCGGTCSSAPGSRDVDCPLGHRRRRQPVRRLERCVHGNGGLQFLAAGSLDRERRIHEAVAAVGRNCWWRHGHGVWQRYRTAARRARRCWTRGRQCLWWPRRPVPASSRAGAATVRAAVRAAPR